MGFMYTIGSINYGPPSYYTEKTIQDQSQAFYSFDKLAWGLSVAVVLFVWHLWQGNLRGIISVLVSSSLLQLKKRSHTEPQVVFSPNEPIYLPALKSTLLVGLRAVTFWGTESLDSELCVPKTALQS